MQRAYLVFLTLLTWIALLLPNTVLANNGVDDLRGRWDIVVTGGGLEGRNFIVYINDVQTGANKLLAAGCMETNDSEALAPLSMQAIAIEGGYNIILASTVVPQIGQPFIIQFRGPVKIFGKGVKDDQAGGSESTIIWGSSGGGTWEGTHHDRRRTDCPPVEIPPFKFSADVRERRDLSPNQPTHIMTTFEGRTDIVSSGMLVQKPDGTIIVVPPFTDIFSPNVDFITNFRYLTSIAGEPISGQAYTLTLLDALGNPIPGATKSDTWTGCFIIPPTNLLAMQQLNQDIHLAWDPVPTAPGFDPANGVGFYQIGINPSPSFPNALSYGSNLIRSTYHIIPWQDFVPGTAGVPDGFNLGVGINELPDGYYQIRLDSYSVAPPGSPGTGLECETVDFGEALYFYKDGVSITFE